MFKNHIKIAWRNLKASPLFSTINILGLTLSLAITTLLFLFIYYENSFDSMYVKKDNIYRITLHTDESFNNVTYANAPSMVAPSVVENIPEVTDAVRFLKHGFGDQAYINTGDTQFIEPLLFYADPSLFNIFDIKLTSGVAKTALDNPNTAIISSSTAQRYFGSTQVVGKTFRLDDNIDIEITGVYNDLPANSTLDANVYVSFATSFFSRRPSWSNASLETYILTSAGARPAAIEAKMQKLLDKNVEKEGQWYTLKTQPFSEVHLYSQNIQSGYSTRKGSIDQVKSLTWLALLILVIASINYMNLTTARSQKRSREVGVSKTLGASVSNLIARFYIETGFITLISIILGIGLALLCLPYFNQLAGKEVPSSLLVSGAFIGSMLLIWIVVTLLAGSYPALYMSSFSAKKILNGGKTGSFWATTVRQGLVVLQFTASAVLIIGVYVIYSQLRFIQEKDLGFRTEQVMAIAINGINDPNKVQLLEQELLRLTEVSDAGVAQGYPGKDVSGRMVFNSLQDDGGLAVQTNRADAKALHVMELHFLAGKNLPETKVKNDTLAEVVINKKIADYLGYTPEEAIGKPIMMLPGEGEYIVGVVDNFNFASLREPIGAYAFHNYDSERKEFILIKLNVSDLSKSITSIENTFKGIASEVPFDYSFMDQNIEKLYKEEQQTASVGMIFSLLAVFVACLGLFGLAAFTAEQRDKEISIRKVLGATVLEITKLLSADFIKLVGIALLIAFPLAYYLMSNWLQEFAYRIDLSWTPFVFTGICSLAVALITVSLQSVKAAMRNPIGALKKE